MGRQGDECQSTGGRPHDEIQPALANTLGDADRAFLLASLDGLHYETSAGVPDAESEVLVRQKRERQSQTSTGRRGNQELTDLRTLFETGGEILDVRVLCSADVGA